MTCVNSVFGTSCTLCFSFQFFRGCVDCFWNTTLDVFLLYTSKSFLAGESPNVRHPLPLETRQETQLVEDDGRCCNPHRKELNCFQLSRAPRARPAAFRLTGCTQLSHFMVVSLSHPVFSSSSSCNQLKGAMTTKYKFGSLKRLLFSHSNTNFTAKFKQIIEIIKKAFHVIGDSPAAFRPFLYDVTEYRLSDWWPPT